MTVLIVDDNGTNLKLLRAVLEAEGHGVLAATDGLAALAVLEREPIDAVISDILMPNMDGYRFCAEVRASPRFCSLPFIVYTATCTEFPRNTKLGKTACGAVRGRHVPERRHGTNQLTRIKS